MNRKYEQIDKAISKKIMNQVKGQVIESRCQECYGSGKYTDNSTCKHCGGKGSYNIQY